MSTTGHENEVVRVSGLKATMRMGGNLGIPNKAACSTAAATAAKTITLKEGFALEDGAMVLVTFENAITVAAATLAVTYTDTTGTQQTTSAYAIKYKGAALAANLVGAGSMLTLRLVYDSTTPANSYWNVVGDINTDTTYNPAKLGSGKGTCSTAAATAAKTVDITDYELVTGGIVTVRFANAITVANATLNVSTKGAKDIYLNGAALAANIIKAGDEVMLQYNGTQYEIISIESAPVYTQTSKTGFYRMTI